MNNRSEEDYAAADLRWSEADPSSAPGEVTDTPTPSSDVDEFDAIEGRAAQLMARMAAQRLQRQAQQADEVPEPTEAESWDAENEYEPETVEAADAPLQYSEPEPPVFEQPRIPEDEAVPDDTERPPSTKQMVLPPWQSFTPTVNAEFDAAQDVPQRPAEAGPPVAEDDGPAADAEQPSAESLAPPPWPPRPPMPEPDWQGPPPGWPPGMPPLPPGWQGPPPWMLAPDQMLAPSRPDRGDSAPRKPADSRQPRDQDVPEWAQQPALHSTMPGDYGAPQAFRMPPSLDEAEIDNRGRHTPESGWQRAVYQVTGGLINPGLSRKDRERHELLEQIRQPIGGDFRIAVLSLKGGVGKTTTTLGLGSALATVRTDRVIAIDANPDRGTLAERVPDSSTTSTVRDLLRDPNIKRYADVRNHTRMAPSRLEVLASEQDPEVAEVFGETDYRRTMDILRHYYNIILTDCGTGIMHSAMGGVLDFANAVVLVTSAAIDSARSASATLDWLTQHGHGALVREAHVVLTAPKSGSAALKVDKVVEHFGARCKSTHVIPFERHLAEGAHFDFGLLKPATTRAYLELAGAVSEKFSRQRQAYAMR